jgi:hypothetical protein
MHYTFVCAKSVFVSSEESTALWQTGTLSGTSEVSWLSTNLLALKRDSSGAERDGMEDVLETN